MNYKKPKRRYVRRIKPNKNRPQEKIKLVIGYRTAIKEVLREAADLLARIDISHLRSSRPHESFLPVTDAVLIEHEQRNFERARDIVVKRLIRMIPGGVNGNAK